MRALPETVVEAPAAKRFYVDDLGFDVQEEWLDVVMFGAPTAPERR